MRSINIIVRDKIATNPTRARYVCGNSDFVIRFDFDEEWNEIKTKTARFVYGNSYQDQVFEGDECPVPIISNVNVFEVGVFAGNLRTSTSASVPADKSILCKGGLPVNPAPNVYSQIMELLNKGGSGNSFPETADPLKQLVTDASGKVAWEDRLAYKYTKTEKGYAYVYQDAEMASDDGEYMLPTPPVASPVAGETYTVIIGGNEYTSKCVDASALTGGLESYVFGNAAAMGESDDLPIENPAPDAPYFIMLMPGGSDGFYGLLVSTDSVDSPILTIRSTEKVETTTTNIKKVDKELLDVPTPDMKAGVGEDGYIANRPCWVYEMPKDKFYNGPGIVWDGVIEGKEALYMTLNGETRLVGYKVCPVPMTAHTFYNKLSAYSYSYYYNADGTNAGTKRIINTLERVTNGLTAIKRNTGEVLYCSFDADETGNSLAEFSGGGTGIYITPEHAAAADYIVWATGNIAKPLGVDMLPPAETEAGNQTVYYWRWSPSENVWKPVTIDQLKADLGLT